MDRDQWLGVLILVGSVLGIVIYGYLLISWPTLVLQITAFIAVAALLGILAWIGYTMATTPPPTLPEELTAETGTEETTVSSEAGGSETSEAKESSK